MVNENQLASSVLGNAAFLKPAVALALNLMLVYVIKVSAIIANNGLDNSELCGDAPEAELKRNSSLKK